MPNLCPYGICTLEKEIANLKYNLISCLIQVEMFYIFNHGFREHSPLKRTIHSSPFTSCTGISYFRYFEIVLRLSPTSWRLPSWLRWSRVHMQCRGPGFNPWVRKIPWRRSWQSTPVFLPGESHGQRSQVGHSPRGRKESHTTETHTHSQTWSIQPMNYLLLGYNWHDMDEP